MAKTDPPPEGKLRSIPTAADEMAAIFAQHSRLLAQIIANARQIAKARRALYVALIAEGFEEAQALELCRYSSL